MKKMLLFILIAVLFACFTGCQTQLPEPSESSGAASSGTVSTNSQDNNQKKKELRYLWWGSEERNIATLKAMEIFENRTGIVMVGEYVAYDGYFDKLSAQMAGGTAPDIFQNEPNRIASQESQLVDLTNKIDFTDFDQVALDTQKVNGKLYGTPLTISIPALAYNKTLLDKYGVEPPAFPYTYEDLTKKFIEITEKSGGEVVGCADHSVWAGVNQGFQAFVAAHDPSVVDILYPYDAEKLTITEDHLATWFQYWADLRAVKAVAPPELSISSQAVEESVLAKGIAAFMEIPIGGYATHCGQTNDDIRILPLPVGLKMTGVGVGYGIVNSVYGKSKYLDDAISFADFFVNDPEAGIALKGVRGILPTQTQRDAFAASPEITDLDKRMLDCVALVTKNNCTGAEGDPSFKAAGDLFNALQLLDQVGQEVAFGKLDIEKAPAEFLKRAEKIIQSFK